MVAPRASRVTLGGKKRGGRMESLQEIQIRIEALRQRIDEPIRPTAPIAETGSDAGRRARALRARRSSRFDNEVSTLKFDERSRFEGDEVIRLQA